MQLLRSPSRSRFSITSKQTRNKTSASSLMIQWAQTRGCIIVHYTYTIHIYTILYIQPLVTGVRSYETLFRRQLHIFDQAMFVHKPLTHHGAARHSTLHIYLSWPEIISGRLVRRFLRQLASCDSSQLVIKGTRTPLQQETRYDTNSSNDLKDTCCSA